MTGPSDTLLQKKGCSIASKRQENSSSLKGVGFVARRWAVLDGQALAAGRGATGKGRRGAAALSGESTGAPARKDHLAGTTVTFRHQHGR